MQVSLHSCHHQRYGRQRGTCRPCSGCRHFWERAVCPHRAIQGHLSSVAKKLLVGTAILQAAGEHSCSLQPQETSTQQLFQACCRSGRDISLNKAGQEIYHVSEARKPALEGEQLTYPPDQSLSFLQALAPAGLWVEMRGYSL